MYVPHPTIRTDRCRGPGHFASHERGSLNASHAAIRFFCGKRGLLSPFAFLALLRIGCIILLIVPHCKVTHLPTTMSLTHEETTSFFKEIDKDKDGYISERDISIAFQAYQSKFSGKQTDYDLSPTGNPLDDKAYDENQFRDIIKLWEIPTLKPRLGPTDKFSKAYESKLPIGRRLRAHWAVEGRLSTFVTLVFLIQTGMGVWLLVKELRDQRKRQLLGWGLILAKTSAGVIYPSMALTILASSRRFATFLRRWPFFSMFINWDLSQSFHIKIAVVTGVFVTLHVVGHLGGTFVYLARSADGVAYSTLHDFNIVRPTYGQTMSTVPGVTGLLSFAILCVIFIFSLPTVRRNRFEWFQLAHLLVFPLIALLMAHGTKGWLQAPMLGYWLALPTLLLIYERGYRIVNSFIRIPVEVVSQDNETSVLILTRQKPWKFLAGQYVLIRIPQISSYQWHPFTVSSCDGNNLTLHVRITSGKWTSDVRKIPFTYANVDGPFGAPAQRFYDFDRTIVIGTGIGITPYAGILADKELKSRSGREEKPNQSVDFHWIVRDRVSFDWFADLLNQVARKNKAVHVSTYLTSKSSSVAEHVFCVLLDRYRSSTQSTSRVTGLDNTTRFSRPNFSDVMQHNMDSLPPDFSGRVGVFFCGPKYIGMEIADRCAMLSASNVGKRQVTWEFISEVY